MESAFGRGSNVAFRRIIERRNFDANRFGCEGGGVSLPITVPRGASNMRSLSI